MEKIKDFGEKIGGARKDTWKIRGLIWQDTVDMTASEKDKYIRRDQIWPKPDIKKMIEEGTPRFIVYWQNEIRKCVYPTPAKGFLADNENDQKKYIEEIRNLKKCVENVKSENDIKIFMASEHKIADNVVNKRTFLRCMSQYGIRKMKKKMESTGFGLSKEKFLDTLYPVEEITPERFIIEDSLKGEKTLGSYSGNNISYYYIVDSSLDEHLTFGNHVLLDKKKHRILLASASKEKCDLLQEKLITQQLNTEKSRKRKSKWIPPQLKNIKREGIDFRKGINVSGQDLIDAFGIRGGEFGNWTNDSDRIYSLNLAFDAFMDLAKVLRISRLDIGLTGLQHGSLAIAFGARGKGGSAVAHYEPLKEVINITKMHGAGSLAHEWGHALDDLIGKNSGFISLGTKNFSQGMNRMPDSFVKLIKALTISETGSKTIYYKNALKIDQCTSKDNHGYWSSKCELFARAFACYIMDRSLELNIRDDYLYGHAQCALSGIPAYPQGDEREHFNHLFDQLILQLKEELNLFHEPIESYEILKVKTSFIYKRNKKNCTIEFKQQDDGQLSLF